MRSVAARASETLSEAVWSAAWARASSEGASGALEKIRRQNQSLLRPDLSGQRKVGEEETEEQGQSWKGRGRKIGKPAARKAKAVAE